MSDTEVAPWAKDALFLVTAFGDGRGAILVKGWTALCNEVVDQHYFQPDADQRAEVLDRLTNWDEWQCSDEAGRFQGAPYHWQASYEDGGIGVTRVTLNRTEAPHA